MEQFTADFIVNLSAELGALIAQGVYRRFRQKWQGDEMGKAIERCINTAVLAMVSHASVDKPELESHLADILLRFFKQDVVINQIIQLIRGQPFDKMELAYWFDESGYSVGILPGFQLPIVLEAFQLAFLLEAIDEPALRPIVHTHQAQIQTQLQGEMVVLLRQLIAANRAEPTQSLSIQTDGKIVASDKAKPTGFHWENIASTERISALKPYLTWLTTEQKTLSLRAISSGKIGITKQPPELTKVYITLQTKKGNSVLDTLTQHQIIVSRDNRDAEEIIQPQYMLLENQKVETIIWCQRLVLLGDPGGGKSTFINHLSYCLASHFLYPDQDWLQFLPDWPEKLVDIIPLPIVLRDFARWLPSNLPKKVYPHLIWDFVTENWHKHKFEDGLATLEARLNEGKILLLFDGLDEVTTSELRRFVRDAVLAFGERYKHCPILVTCRTLFYQSPALDREEEDIRFPSHNYPTYELAQFNEEQQSAFVVAWYGELKRQGYLPGQDEKRLQMDLQQAIGHSDLQRVAGNPLLLTVMAMVHMEGGHLPDARALLYNRTIDLLLSRWEEVKDEGIIPRLRQLLSEADRSDVDLKIRLASIAFQVHIQAGGEAADEQSDIEELYLIDELSFLHKKNLGWAQQLLQVIKTRAGLLIERLPGQFAFPHQTFQEYLAGVHLAVQSNFAEQALKWAKRDVVWWQMILFAVEHLVYVQERPLAPLQLISQLCPKEQDETISGWRLVWLAGEVILGMGLARVGDSEWGEILLLRVRQRLSRLLDEGQLVVRERAEAGRVLARLGDLRIGVGINLKTSLPDIAWGRVVPAGIYWVGTETNRRNVTVDRAFRLAQYPITYAQFQCFLDDVHDEKDRMIWNGLPEDTQQIRKAHWSYANHPRETVNWYQAVAFCRWLSQKLGYIVELPTEIQWEVATQWSQSNNEKKIYPWGVLFEKTKANTIEGGVRQTTPVGMYPAGRNEALGLYDLSGNVWEWCRKSGAFSRTVRGGSWRNSSGLARISVRSGYSPDFADDDIGFRIATIQP